MIDVPSAGVHDRTLNPLPHFRLHLDEVYRPIRGHRTLRSSGLKATCYGRLTEQRHLKYTRFVSANHWRIVPRQRSAIITFLHFTTTPTHTHPPCYRLAVCTRFCENPSESHPGGGCERQEAAVLAHRVIRPVSRAHRGSRLLLLLLLLVFFPFFSPVF